MSNVDQRQAQQAVEGLVTKAVRFLDAEGLPDTPDNFDWAVGQLMGDPECVAPSVEHEQLARIMRQEMARARAFYAVRMLVRVFAVAALVFFAGCFGWFVMPVVPISIPLVIGFGGAIALLLIVCRPGRGFPD